MLNFLSKGRFQSGGWKPATTSVYESMTNIFPTTYKFKIYEHRNVYFQNYSWTVLLYKL